MRKRDKSSDDDGDGDGDGDIKMETEMDMEIIALSNGIRPTKASEYVYTLVQPVASGD